MERLHENLGGDQCEQTTWIQRCSTKAHREGHRTRTISATTKQLRQEIEQRRRNSWTKEKVKDYHFDMFKKLDARK
eukprot:5626203-Amphidinium_carterae.4